MIPEQLVSAVENNNNNNISITQVEMKKKIKKSISWERESYSKTHYKARTL